MAKKSPAKVKKLAAEAKRNAAAAREAKKAGSQNASQKSGAEFSRTEELEEEWRKIGLAAPARRALVEDGLFQLSDLRKISLDAVKELNGMGPNAIRILVSEMKKLDLNFRK